MPGTVAEPRSGLLPAPNRAPCAGSGSPDPAHGASSASLDSQARDQHQRIEFRTPGDVPRTIAKVNAHPRRRNDLAGWELVGIIADRRFDARLSDEPIPVVSATSENQRKYAQYKCAPDHYRPRIFRSDVRAKLADQANYSTPTGARGRPRLDSRSSRAAIPPERSGGGLARRSTAAGG